MPKQVLKHHKMKKEYNRQLFIKNEYDKKIRKIISRGKILEGDDKLFLILHYISKINKINKLIYMPSIDLNAYIKKLKQ